MTNNRSSYRPVSHQYDLVAPAKGIAYLIDRIDWEYIKSCLSKLKIEAPIFAQISALFGGAFLSGVLAILTAPACVAADAACVSSKGNLITYTVVTLVLALLCGLFAKRLKSQDKASVQDIQNFIKNVEDKLDKGAKGSG